MTSVTVENILKASEHEGNFEHILGRRVWKGVHILGVIASVVEINEPLDINDLECERPFRDTLPHPIIFKYAQNGRTLAASLNTAGSLDLYSEIAFLDKLSLGLS